MADTYLITGGEGFIGSKIVKEIDGIAYDLKSGFDILEEDRITDALKGKAGVFHCAAKISVPESFEKPEEYYSTNVDGTRMVIRAAEAAKAKIIFSSSAAVYGEANEVVIEDTILNPKSPYAHNKLVGENLLKASSTLSDGPAHIALRYFNVYGPGQSAQYAGVITFFIKAAFANEDIKIHGDGNQVRDFVFVDDVVRANALAMLHKNKEFEVFNIGSGKETKIKDLAEMIIRLTASTSKIVHAKERQGDIMYSQADISKAEKMLSWKALTTLEEGLVKTIEYYKRS